MREEPINGTGMVTGPLALLGFKQGGPLSYHSCSASTTFVARSHKQARTHAPEQITSQQGGWGLGLDRDRVIVAGTAAGRRQARRDGLVCGLGRGRMCVYAYTHAHVHVHACVNACIWRGCGWWVGGGVGVTLVFWSWRSHLLHVGRASCLCGHFVSIMV